VRQPSRLRPRARQQRGMQRKSHSHGQRPSTCSCGGVARGSGASDRAPLLAIAAKVLTVAAGWLRRAGLRKQRPSAVHLREPSPGPAACCTRSPHLSLCAAHACSGVCMHAYRLNSCTRLSANRQMRSWRPRCAHMAGSNACAALAATLCSPPQLPHPAPQLPPQALGSRPNTCALAGNVAPAHPSRPPGRSATTPLPSSAPRELQRPARRPGPAWHQRGLDSIEPIWWV